MRVYKHDFLGIHMLFANDDTVEILNVVKLLDLTTQLHLLHKHTQIVYTYSHIRTTHNHSRTHIQIYLKSVC